MHPPIALAAAIALAASSFPDLAPAQGPERRPPLANEAVPNWPASVRVASLHVRTDVRDGVASTEIDQVLRNDGGRDAEAIWILPLPDDATVDGFTMTVGDQEVVGEVLDANRARGIYEQIVRQRRDPGLLEYFGDACLRARVFPIPPRGDVAVKVRFRHLLPRHAGMYEWRFPLRALRATGMRPERTSLDLRLSSAKSLRNVWSPVPGTDVVRHGDHDARVALELPPGCGLERDLEVLYSLADGDFGVNALTYRRDGDGYFMLMLSPRRDLAGEATPRCVQFVLDTSGSMAGRKIEQAKAALRFFLRSLRPSDRFDVVPFATEAEPFFGAAVAAEADTIAQALAKVDRIQARGGTNIEDALTRALAANTQAAGTPAHLLPIVVFLTDGAPTVGQTDRNKLLATARELARARVRIFVLGVGNDVDTKLLDDLAEGNRGARDYVREDEDIEVKTSELFTKLGHPALAEPTLAIEGVATHDVQTTRGSGLGQLPDLFAGDQLVVYGRYTGSGPATIRLAGMLGEQRREFRYEAVFAAQDGRHDFVPTLWAQCKLARLLDAIRLHGRHPELEQEVLRLAKEFGIVTAFTSHLVVEEGLRLAGGRTPPPVPLAGAGDRGAAGAETRPGAPLPEHDARRRLDALGEQAQGRAAVRDSVELKALREGGVAAPRERGSDGDVPLGSPLARRIGGRTLLQVDGRWLDQACPPDWSRSAERIEAFSQGYFDLLAKAPDLKEVLALGTSVVFRLGDRVIEIVPPAR